MSVPSRCSVMGLCKPRDNAVGRWNLFRVNTSMQTMLPLPVHASASDCPECRLWPPVEATTAATVPTLQVGDT